MSIVNFSPYHQYLYSPNSYLHTVPANYKIVFTIVYICSIPFSYYTFIITIYIIILTYWNFYKYLKMKYSYKNRLSTNIFVYIVIIGILLLSSRQIVAKNYTCTEMNYPYLIIKNSLLIINLRFIYIPNILLKACLIIYHTISLLYTLFHTTRLENINLILLSIFYKSPKRKIYSTNYFYFLVLFLHSYFILS